MAKIKGKIRVLFAAGLMLGLCNHGLSQETVTVEEIFLPGIQLGIGARALGMGGAYSSLGGDYSAAFWNPAALADIRRVEFFGSLGHLMRENTAEFDVFGADQEASFTKLNELGFAYPVPTIRGSLVLGFGFHRVKSFDDNFAFQWFNATPGDSVTQAWRDHERGSLNAWVLSGAVDVSPNMSIGIGLNFWTGGQNLNTTFREVDSDDFYTFDSYTTENTLDTDISGFNIKAGGLFRMGRFMRIGFGVSTPTTFNIEEFWTADTLLTFDDQSFDDVFSEGQFEYKIRSPWTFSAGASINLLNFVFSGDAEYADWSQIEYKSEPPFAGLSETAANRLIREEYRATLRTRVGAEFTLPLTGISFRAGYMRHPSILQNRDPEEDKQFLTAGMGFLVDKHVKLDVAFVHGFWKSFNSTLDATDDVTNLVEDIKINKVFMTLAFRL